MQHHKSTSIFLSPSTGKKNWSRAFTLAEVLVTVALFVILMLGIAQLYVVYGRVITFQQSSIGIALGGSSIMDAVRAAGLQAQNIVAAHTFSGTDYSSGTTTAIFELPAIGPSGDILAGIYDYIAVYAEGATAYRIIDAAPGSARLSGEKQLTNALDALTFTYDSPDFPTVASVTVDATTSAVVQGETAQTHLHERVYLRNL